MLAGCGTRITGVTLTVPSTLERGAVGEAIPEYTYDGDIPEADEAAELAEKQGLRYASSNPEVVEVDEEGLLTTLSAGTAEITLTSEDGELSASGTVTVVVSATGLTMPETLELPLGGEPQSVAATVEPADATRSGGGLHLLGRGDSHGGRDRHSDRRGGGRSHHHGAAARAGSRLRGDGDRSGCGRRRGGGKQRLVRRRRRGWLCPHPAHRLRRGSLQLS